MSWALATLFLFAQDRPRTPEDPGLLGWGVYARVEAWYPRIEGDVSVDDRDSTLTLDGDLDIESPGWTGVFEVGILRRSRGSREATGLAFSGMSFSSSGRETLSSNETFAKHLFPAGTEVRSRFRFTEVGLDGILAGVDHPEAEEIWRCSLGLHYIEAEIEMDSPAGSESEDYVDINLRLALGGEWRPISWAFVGAGVALYTDFFTLFGGGDPGHAAGEFEAYGGFQWGPVRVEGGYRLFGWSLDMIHEEEEIDLFLHGPWLAATLRF